MTTPSDPVMPEVFTITPLVWLQSPNADYPDWWTAQGRGGYQVEKDRGQWKWKYCWDEYYDEDEISCERLEDGKQQAEAHYRERVLEFLTRTALIQKDAADLERVIRVLERYALPLISQNNQSNSQWAQPLKDTVQALAIVRGGKGDKS